MSNDTLVKRLANAGLVLMPAQLTDEELTKAQGALLDMNWDAVECFAARVAELYRVTRHRVEEAATILEQQAAEIERLKEALRRLCRSFPTDTDMVSAGWSAAEIEEGCAAHAAAYGILKEIGHVE